jgi:hypothetical protein
MLGRAGRELPPGPGPNAGQIPAAAVAGTMRLSSTITKSGGSAASRQSSANSGPGARPDDRSPYAGEARDDWSGNTGFDLAIRKLDDINALEAMISRVSTMHCPDGQ